MNKQQQNGQLNGKTAVFPPAPNPDPSVPNGDSDHLTQIWTQRAYKLAQPPIADKQTATIDLLLFLLGNERYGIQVQYIREIYPHQRITPVPRTPAYVIGVFSARGQLISVIDFCTFVGLPPVDLTSDSKIMVMRDPTGHMEIGLIADKIEDVITIAKEEIEPAMVSQLGQRAHFIQGIAPDMLIVLNAHHLLNDSDLPVHEELS